MEKGIDVAWIPIHSGVKILLLRTPTRDTPFVSHDTNGSSCGAGQLGIDWAGWW